MTATTYPNREPAPGPAVVLDQPALYKAVRAHMDAEGFRHAKEVSDATGIDRNTIGRFLARGRAGTIVTGQRGGLNVNAFLTLVAWVGDPARPASYGKTIRTMPRPTEQES